MARAAHISIKDYMLSEKIKNGRAPEYSVSEPLAHSIMAQSCLAYILHLETLPFDSCLAKPLQLSSYVSQYWIRHMILAQENQDGSTTWVMAKQVLAQKKDNGVTANWVKLAGFSTPLEAVAYYGHQPIVQYLLGIGEDVNDQGAEGDLGGSALQAASSQGHEAVVRFLLDKGANVNAVGKRYGSALQAASLDGNTDIVRLLLEEGADVNLKGGPLGSALLAAKSGGYDAVAKLLLDRGAVVEDDSAMII